VAHKADVETAADIARALDDTESLKGGNLVMVITRDAKQAKPKSLPLKSISRHIQFPESGGGLTMRLALDMGPGLFVSQAVLNELWVGSDLTALRTVMEGDVSIIGPQLRCEIRPHRRQAVDLLEDPDADADDDETVVSPVLMPTGKIKEDRKAIREAKRQRRQLREARRAERSVGKLQKEADLLQKLDDLGFGRRTLHHCTKCRFRCFSDGALTRHVCNLLGQRTIKGRTRKPRDSVPEALTSGTSSAGSSLIIGAGTGSISAGISAIVSPTADDDDVEVVGDDESPVAYRDSSSESDGTAKEDDSDAHSDDCSNDVVVVAVEDDSEGEDRYGGESKAPCPASGVYESEASDVKVGTADVSASMEPDASGAIGWCPSFGTEGSCRYPPPKKGQKFPDDVVKYLELLFPLKLKAPQVLELMETKYNDDQLEEYDITARRIKNWQGAEHQRRLKLAKKKVLEAQADSTSPMAASAPDPYAGYTVADLKELLKGRGLKVGGNKADLLLRVKADDTARNMVHVLETDSISDLH
jgi:hypothetical protein